MRLNVTVIIELLDSYIVALWTDVDVHDIISKYPLMSSLSSRKLMTLNTKETDIGNK